MQLIAAVDKHWAIGKNGQMLAVIPADQKLFRQETIGKVVVMGRKTLESLPGGRPLESRTNIVLTRDPAFKVKGAVTVHSMEEARRFTNSFCLTARKPTLRLLITSTTQIPTWSTWNRRAGL